MKKYLVVKMIALFAAILCFGVSHAWGADLYVDASVAGGDGTSWETAFADLQEALAAASDGDTIHVAQGTYVPGEAQNDSFVMTQNLTLLGGYPTGGGDRDPAANQTVLSGEIGDADYTNNIYHVVNIYGYDFGVTLDGFTITRGYAGLAPYNTGGGMFVSGGCEVTLRNVTFSNNRAVGGGGGLRFSGPRLTLDHVEFFANLASEGNGGGLLFEGGSLIMNHVDFVRNIAIPCGGGLHFSGESTMDMNNVNFSRNGAVSTPDFPIARGGGIYVTTYSYDVPLNMTNVTLSGNMANGTDQGQGGGIYVARGPDYAPIALTNVTLSGNQANGKYALGGGICLGFGHWRYMVLTNVTIYGNQANGAEVNGSAWGGGVFLAPPCDVAMLNVTVAGNIANGKQTALGGGVYAIPQVAGFPYWYARTFFRNSIFWGNEPDQLQDVSAYWCIVEGGYGAGNISEDPMLGTLGNYGGFTQTIPLLEGSSAIDTAETNTGLIPDTDQRGELRPQGAGCDIGAYEASVNIGNIRIDPSDPAPVNAKIYSEAIFTNTLSDTNTYSATWDWGDGNSSPGVIDTVNKIVTGEHVYAEPGVYTVGLEVTEVNEDINSAGFLKTGVYQYVVVYDPAAGFVTGGGWFDSPAGAYKNDPTLAGEATFGFVSKYKKGATAPIGNTAFEFATGDLSFHSTSYDWLVVTGSDYARFKGSGTINGGGDYKFLLWAGDGEPDTFRIRIWEENEETGEETDIYDNGFDQAIGGGSIVIHSK